MNSKSLTHHEAGVAAQGRTLLGRLFGDSHAEQILHATFGHEPKAPDVRSALAKPSPHPEPLPPE